MLRKIVICDNSESKYTMVLEVEVPSSSFDFDSAIRNAALEYCRSSEGRKTYEWTSHQFNWGDFVDNVPANICQNHGFTIVSVSRADMVAELNEQLVDEEGVYGCGD